MKFKFMPSDDHLQRFIFEEADVRGEMVQLDTSLSTILSQQKYPPSVANLLAEALTAVTLLSGTIKFQGSLILQIRGDGLVPLLVAQATHKKTIRGTAHWRDEIKNHEFKDLVGNNTQLSISILNDGSEPYQGIIALDSTNLMEALENYFQLSEQLPTRLWLAVHGQKAKGMLLQKIPSKSLDDEKWEHINHLANTLTPEELLELSNEEMLTRLFYEENIRIYDQEPVSFRCNCSKSLSENILKLLGKAELEEILEEQGVVEVNCEFCSKTYTFDPIDVQTLFMDQTISKSNPSIQ